MPNSLAIGVPYETFWHLSPKKLKIFYKAYEKKRKILDEEMWIMGIYVKEAFGVIMSQFAAGLAQKKSNAKYMENPIMQQSKPLSENEIQKQRELFVKKLIIMQKNFELSNNGNHKT